MRRTTTVPVLTDEDLERAVKKDHEIEVVCFLQEHKWKLSEQDKDHLSNLLARRASASSAKDKRR